MNHGLIKAIEKVLSDQSPLDVKTITERVDGLIGIPFVNKRDNINSLLAQEVHKERPRWRKIQKGTYGKP